MITAPGKANADTNPACARPRNVSDASIGSDNLFHTEHVRWTLRLGALNITTDLAMYNFLFTCSAMYLVSPPAHRAEVRIVFRS
jgi:hypothetical protein